MPLPNLQKINGDREQESWEPNSLELSVYRAYARGDKTQTQIAEEYEMSHQTAVSKLVAKINTWMWPIELERIREMKAEHAQRLFHIYEESMVAWQLSKLDEITTVKTRTRDKATGDTTTVTTRGKVGNPVFLARAESALDQIRKIWGANAPLEVRHTGEVRIAGRSREQAIKERIERLTKIRETLLIPSEN